MDIEKAIEFALDGEAVLFAGSGCSLGAQNLNGLDFKTGQQLSDYFAIKCGLSKGIPLDETSDEYAEKFGEDNLIKYLISEYKVKKVASHHNELAKIPWKRIYTTNYDNVLETAYSKEGKSLRPVILKDDAYSIPKNVTLCVHLNGYIDTLDRKTLGMDFKLTETSYLMPILEQSPWIMLFREDIRLARAVFFLGYSLYDLDIKRILYEDQLLKDKAIFILGPSPDEMTIRRADKFGTLFKKSVETLAEDIAQTRNVYIPTDPSNLSLLSIKEYQLATPTSSISDQNFIDLLLQGNVDRSMIAESYRTGEKYYLNRSATEHVFEQMEKGYRVLVACSNLGNGKSLFLEGVNYNAKSKGYRVFEVKERSELVAKEIESIAKLEEKTLLIIEDYQNWLDEIRFFRLHASDNATLILTARTSIHDVLFDDLSLAAGLDSFVEIHLDNLTDQDIEWLIEAFEEFGLWGELAGNTKLKKLEFVTKLCRRQFHAILLKLLNSPTIRNRLIALFRDLKQQRYYYEIINSIFVLAILNQLPTINTLIDLWGVEVIGSSRFRKHPVVRQLVDFQSSEIIVKSSVAAEYFLKNISDSAIIVEVLTRMAHRAHDLSRISPRYKIIFNNLMKFSNLQIILPEEGRRAAVVRYYESLKNLEYCKTFPLFWLQYAISCLVHEDLFRAKKYFETAYSYAEKKDWDTFQIDNHFARFLLVEALDLVDTKKAMANFRKAETIISKQIQNERLHYPYAVALRYRDFAKRHFASLSDSESLTVKQAAKKVLKRIEKLPELRRRDKNIRACKEAMEDVLAM